MKTVAVTGALGNSGRAIVKRLAEAGYEIVRIDRMRSSEPFFAPSRAVDLTNYGDALANLQGSDAVVHFGSDPWPDTDFFTGAQRYLNNTSATFNVFQAACQLGIRRVVWASSEMIQGNPYETAHPRRIPIRETDPPMPQCAYAVSKLNSEQAAEHLHRMHGTVFVGLRCANILYDTPGHNAGFDRVPGYWKDSSIRRETLWKYVDSRDVAEIALAGLTANLEASEVFNVSAADTIMNVPTRDLFAKHFPDVEIAPELGEFETPVSLAKAAEMLGWQPRYSWRDVLSA